MSFLRARHDQEPRGVLVEAVHDPRALRVAPTKHFSQLVHQGRAGVGRGRMDDQARRLVDDGEGRVEMDDQLRGCHR